MRVAADARHADPFAAKLLQPGDFRLGENALGHDVLDTADKDQVRGAAGVGIDDADSAEQTNLDIVAENRRRRG